MYFRATGGSGGAGATLTVTYSEDFYGLTITATNGTRTLTKVATSSGSVVFRLPADGTWTVSATVEGQTYSESVLVDTAYSTELSALPTGSTATPVNVIQTWLKCAQIKDKNYTTLSQVLNDTATLEALVSDSNACDYMVRSTSWASDVCADADAMALIGKFNYCANKLLSNSTWETAIRNSPYSSYVDPEPAVYIPLVPKMTSNTTPSGECSQSSTHAAAYAAYACVDGKGETPSVLSPSDTENWWQYEFDTPTIVNRIRVKELGNSSHLTPTSFWSSAKLQGSNDGNTFTDLCTINGTISSGVVYEETFNNTTPYVYYRLQILTWGSGASSYKQVAGELQLYGDVDLTENVLFRSAAQDDLYYLDNGSPVIIAHTDDYGYAIVDRDLLPEGVNLTLYSTIAKDPDNLGSAYSRVIHFSKYLTEVYMLPLKTLYWYGYMDDNCEDITSANGWTGYSTLIAPDHNINSISKENVNYNSGIGSKTPVSATSAYCIGYGVGDNTSMTNSSSKALSSYIKTQKLNGTATPALASITELTGSTYINVWGNLGSGRNIFVNALWYE